MNILLFLFGLVWLAMLVLVFSALRISGACSEEERFQEDKAFFEKWLRDHEGLS
jgi:hypothetical protein